MKLKVMGKVGMVLLLIVAWLMAVGGKIWAIVSFLGWLFDKFEVFNWTSIVTMVTGYALIMVTWVMIAAD